VRSEAKASAAAVICGAAGVFAVVGFAPDRASAGRDDITVTLPVTTATVPVPTTLPVTTTLATLPVTTSLPTLSTVTLPTTVPTTVTLPTTTSAPTTTRSGGRETTTGSSAPAPTTTVSGGGAPSEQGTTTTTTPQSGPSGPTRRCRSRGGLPDRRCTPGGTARGFRLARTCSVKRRLPTAPSPRVLDAVFDAYGIARGSRALYRIDRLISTELGGSIARTNLWPQPTMGRLNAPAKNRTEAYLFRLVCAGKLSLRQAQVKLAKNWVAAYRSLPRGAR